MSLELNQDTKGLLNSKERGLWDNVRSIEHMAQIEKSVSYPWGRVMCGVDARGNTFVGKMDWNLANRGRL